MERRERKRGRKKTMESPGRLKLLIRWVLLSQEGATKPPITPTKTPMKRVCTCPEKQVGKLIQMSHPIRARRTHKTPRSKLVLKTPNTSRCKTPKGAKVKWGKASDQWTNLPDTLIVCAYVCVRVRARVRYIILLLKTLLIRATFLWH